jgi:cellulose synthase/poly-beta-1,6-N-acetylglucosamine synthase-like glycosyltransferase
LFGVVATTWILLGLCGSCWALFIYPYAIYPQILRLLSRKHIRRADTQLSASLLFCAYNEAEALPGKIENLRQLKRRSPDLQILVYDDASTDRTRELLASAGDVLTTIAGPGRTGKAAGMKQLVKHATGDILIFTDANVLLSLDILDRLLPYYGDPNVGGASCTIKSSALPGSVTSEIGATYVTLDDKLQELESRTGNVMGASGGLFSIRRELYPDFPNTVQDDFTVSMSVIFQRKRLIKAPDVIAYERTVARRDEELQRKIRIGARAYHTHSFMRARLKKMSVRDRMKYLSRKLLRWFGGVFLALGAVFGIAAVATLSLAAAALMTMTAFILFAVCLRSAAGPGAKAAELILATFATLVGVLRGMLGQTVATWAPAKSR